MSVVGSVKDMLTPKFVVCCEPGAGELKEQVGGWFGGAFIVSVWGNLEPTAPRESLGWTKTVFVPVVE